MKIHFGSFTISTQTKLEIRDITSNIQNVIRESNVLNGLVNIWAPHATAAVTVNENDRELWTDIIHIFERLAPIKERYEHNLKYGWSNSEQNAHAHILSSIIKPSVTVPLRNGRMQLGTWQSILFIELDGPRIRTINVEIIGE
ncbi:MAG: secondary thiamine-phosphate synthase enzyme YjbQ [Nitrososphaerota archaeon]|nr:secondary thiamine-phosphate synthase enzyme YjbQ [Candidatus Bathyarchaeota archaeon]MDW8048613.1 secondary thiamine-phosphate synthase enzyme YjbQ [Nitrososphaerota archaeon]